MGSVTISGNGVSCGCNGCPAATTLKPAVVVTTAVPTTTATTATATTTTVYDKDNLDCVETQDACTSACEAAGDRHCKLVTKAVKNGRACRGATDCMPGEGACPTTTSTATSTIFNAPPSTTTSKKSNKSGAIAGTVVGVLIVLGAAAGAYYVMAVKKAGGDKYQHPDMPVAVVADAAAVQADATHA